MTSSLSSAIRGSGFVSSASNLLAIFDCSLNSPRIPCYYCFQYSRNEILRHFPEAHVIVLTNTIWEPWYVRDNASQIGNGVIIC